MEILYWLRANKANAKGYATIMIRLTIGGVQKDFSSGKMAPVKQWDTKKKEVKGGTAEAARTNMFIKQTEVKLYKIFDKLVEEGRPVNAEIIKNILFGKDQVTVTLKSLIKIHDEHFRSMLGRKGYTLNSYKKYPVLEEKLNRFLKTKNRTDLHLDELDHSFIADFQHWMHLYGSVKFMKPGDPRPGLPMIQNSVVSNLKKLKKVLGLAKRRGLLKIDPFEGIDMAWDQTNANWLEMDQLERIMNKSFQSPTLQLCKDRFIIGCYTGLAHSDISKVTKDDMITSFADRERWLKVGRTKTGEVASIPVFPPVVEILSRYGDHPNNLLFPQMSLNEMNKNLKFVQEACGIPVNLTTHVARHTAAMMFSDMGVDMEVISVVLGHADSSTTKKTYARTSKRLLVDEMKAFKVKMFPVQGGKEELRDIM